MRVDDFMHKGYPVQDTQPDTTGDTPDGTDGDVSWDNWDDGCVGERDHA